jgi:signal transduction histidine kinase/CheY-like chemotaxis protein
VSGNAAQPRTQRIEADGSHAVQFYEHSRFLVTKLARFVIAGLGAGEAVVVMARNDHRARLAPLLKGYRSNRLYVELDAEELLAGILVDGRIDAERFHAAVDPLCRRAEKAGRGRFRVFSEMVALLLDQGHEDAAHELESLWNELLATRSFSLLCAHPLRPFASRERSEDFRRICAAHSIVRPAENLAANAPRGIRDLEDIVDASRTLAELQQTTMALEWEVACRKELESLVRQRDDELGDFLATAGEWMRGVGGEALERELDRRVGERVQELAGSRTKLRALAAEGLAERQVRKDVAIALNDHLAQLLVLTRLKLTQAIGDGTTPGTSLLRKADASLNEAILYTRSLMTELRPPVLDAGLPLALRWLAAQFHTQSLTVATDITNGMVPLSEEQVALLFRAARELLMNVAKHAQTTQAEITLRVQDNLLRLEITDEGRGFDPSSLPSRPWTESRPTKLGLFGIRERLEAAGGRLELHASPIRGTRACVLLPLEDRSPSAQPSAAGEPGRAQANHDGEAPAERAALRVLLVEDHPMMREGLRGVLEAYPDIQVVAEAADGEEAVAQAQRFEPDVIIMDINLPKLDGIQATKRIKRSLPQTVVIGLSVHQASVIEPALREAGADGYVTKDAAAEALYAALQSAARKDRETPSSPA